MRQFHAQLRKAEFQRKLRSQKEDENVESCTRVNAHTRGNCKGSQKEDENMESCTRVHAHTKGKYSAKFVSSLLYCRKGI